MATEAIKMVIGIGEPLIGRLLLFDSLRMSFKDVKVRPNPKCELCGDDPHIMELVDYEAFCNVPLPGQEPEHLDAGFEITGPELKAVLEGGEKVVLLDVREPHEWDIVRLDQAQLTPLSQFEAFIPQLNPEDEILLYCYKGLRSMTALKKLRDKGFTKLRSLTGGIDGYAADVDTSLPRY